MWARAAAEILEYWRVNKGKSSIRGTQYYSTEGDFVNHLYYYHGGSALGTPVANLSGTLKNQAVESIHLSGWLQALKGRAGGNADPGRGRAGREKRLRPCPSK
jgi:hypothetical protein